MADLPLLARFKVDLNTAAVGRHVRAVDADKRGQALDVRVFQNHLCQLLLSLAIAANEIV